MSKSLRPIRFLCVEQLIYRPYNSDPSGASFEVLCRKPLLGFQRGSVRRIFSVFFDQQLGYLPTIVVLPHLPLKTG